MKKSIVIAALGMAVAVESSFGQGALAFNSYLANNSVGVLTTFLVGGAPVSTGYTANLLWSFSPITESANNLAIAPGWSVAGSGSPSTLALGTPYGSGASAGYFQGANNFVMNPYTAGTTVYFQVIAYQTALGYNASLIRGKSASFSTTLNVTPALPKDIGVAGFTPFTVSAVPEPTTLALAGLGGLASLIMLRRKNA